MANEQHSPTGSTSLASFRAKFSSVQDKSIREPRDNSRRELQQHKWVKLHGADQFSKDADTSISDDMLFLVYWLAPGNLGD